MRPTKMLDDNFEKQPDPPNDVAADTAAAPASDASGALSHSKEAGSSEFRGFAIGVLGWLIPGLGHALLKMWGRAIAIFLAVALLVYLGAGIRGSVFAPGSDHAFTRLGLATDLRYP